MFRSKDRAIISHEARLIALLTSMALVTVNAIGNPAFAQSLPTGGQVAAGRATIGTPSNGAMTINQTSANAVVNWQSFTIGQGNAVTFVQPDASSAILNRVTGGTTTSIAGSLAANGQVYLINPNGIAITSTGTINTGAFVASTLGISDDEFMAGKRTFTGNGASGSVINAGAITIDRGGYLALIGGTVENAGTITVPMGKAALGSGEQATLDLAGDGFLQVAIPTSATGTKALVSNSGTISANGGMVQLSAAAARDMARQAVNMAGTVEAKGVAGRSGDITLFGGDGAVAVSGTVNASHAAGKGGTVGVTGRSIKLATARVDASGTTGGGTVNIGGERQGGGTLKRAETLTVDAHTVIDANAISTGNGGDVVLWSDNLTSFAGTISARGGSLSGHGGEAEVSSKALLDYTGSTDLSAANGRFGTLLLDPYNVTISSGTGSNATGFTATGNDSVINVATLQTALAGANVTVSTGSGGSQAGNITVAAPIAWSDGTALTLNAANTITVDAGITFGGAAGAGLILNATYALAVNAPITVRGAGDVTLAYNAGSSTNLSFGLTGSGFSGNLTYLSSTGGALTSDAGGTLRVNGNPYTLVYTMAQLDAIDGMEAVRGTGTTRYGAGLTGRYALAGSLDASGTTYTRALISGSLSALSGTLEGLGHTVTGLTINAPGADFVGLVGRSSGTLRDLGLVGGSVSGSSNVGELVGENRGTITQSYATGSVSGTDKVGGLVGRNEGTIAQSYATGSVAGSSNGGLVGLNNGGTITNSYWDSDTSGQSSSSGGGIGLTTPQARQASSYAGWDFANVWYRSNDMRPILRSEAATAVNGVVTIDNLHQLALVGANLAGSYRIGADIDAAATAGTNAAGIWGAGGFVPIGNDSNAFSGTFDGQERVVRRLVINRPTTNSVGLFGNTRAGSTIRNIGLVGGSVTGDNFVGGLVGTNSGTLTQAFTTGSVTGDDFVGGLVEYNDRGTIAQAYATGSVTGVNVVGGLAGDNTAGTITQAYATGSVTGVVAGGLVGFVAGTITNSVWDTNTTGRGNGVGNGLSAGATGLTTARMQSPFTFIDRGWDFAGVWATPKAGGAPVLRGQSTGSIYDYYIRLSGNTSSTYGDTIGTSGIALQGVGAGNVSVGWGSAISATTNVGAYGYGGRNVVALAYSTGVAGDYYVDYGTGARTVTQRALTVTADAQSRIYGDANPALTYTANGLVNNDTLSGSLTTTAGQFSNVGVYRITQGSLANTNYAINYGDAGLRVNQRALTVTADALSKTYGNANPALTYAATGLVNNDTLSGALATSAGRYSNVGAHGIAHGTLANSNYAVSYTGADLTIGQRSITVAADSLTRSYGADNPDLTWTVGGMGLVNGDALSGSLHTIASRASAPGQYAITQGTLMAAANYGVTFDPGTLTVETLRAMLPGTSASQISRTAFDPSRFADLPPVVGDGTKSADGSTMLIRERLYDAKCRRRWPHHAPSWRRDQAAPLRSECL